jgi:hypothetical protein
MPIVNKNVSAKIDALINESADFIRRYMQDLQSHRDRQAVFEQITQSAPQGDGEFKTPGDVYRPFSPFAPIEPIAQASGGESSSQLLIKGRQ